MINIISKIVFIHYISDSYNAHKKKIEDLIYAKLILIFKNLIKLLLLKLKKKLLHRYSGIYKINVLCVHLCTHAVLFSYINKLNYQYSNKLIGCIYA